jgi:addiction module HigA family antidote
MMQIILERYFSLINIFASQTGLLVRRALIDESGLSITEVASMLGVSRLALSRLINGYSGISPEMAVRLSIALNTSSEM